jgi:8-oxo-dGTP diphosphatase
MVKGPQSCGKLADMVARDGDGWIQCRCGSKHWGLNGAAGLLLFRSGQVLLQHRAPWVHNGDTWGIPGGARDSHESALEAALRESHEEIGIDSNLVSTKFSHLDDHGDWRYETIVAKLEVEVFEFSNNHETIDLKWFFIGEVGSVTLHPSFARSWPAISAQLQDIAG